MEDITLKEIIDYAKINEDNARQFYLNAAEHAKRDNVKTFLLALAKQAQRSQRPIVDSEGGGQRVLERARRCALAGCMREQPFEAGRGQTAEGQAVARLRPTIRALQGGRLGEGLPR